MNDIRPKSIFPMPLARSPLSRRWRVTAAPNGIGDCAPADLRCNEMPAGAQVDAWNTRLSWLADAQEYFQVQVATSISRFADIHPLAWDSGKQRGSHSSIAVPPFMLLDATTYFWRVRTWIGAGHPTAWSAAQCFVTSPGLPPAFGPQPVPGPLSLEGFSR